MLICLVRIDEEMYRMVVLTTMQSAEGDGEWIAVFVCSFAFPGLACPLHVYEPKYRLMIRRVLASGGVFGICVPGNEGDEKPFADYGTILRVRGSSACQDGRLYVDSVKHRLLTAHLCVHTSRHTR